MLSAEKQFFSLYAILTVKLLHDLDLTNNSKIKFLSIMYSDG